MIFQRFCYGLLYCTLFCALAAVFKLFCDKHLILCSVCKRDNPSWRNTWARLYCDLFLTFCLNCCSVWQRWGKPLKSMGI